MSKFWLQQDHIVLDQNNQFLYCENQPCSKEWWIIGKCNGELAGEISVIRSKTMPEIEDTYVLGGPYVYKEYAESIKDTFTSDLAEKCKGNICTSVMTWEAGAGCDLDICVEILGEKYGWGQTPGTEGNYGHWYGDDTSCGNGKGEKVSLKRNELIATGKESVDVLLNAHWYNSTAGSGKIKITILSSKSSTIQEMTCTTHESGKTNYQYLGKFIYYPKTDTMTFIPA